MSSDCSVSPPPFFVVGSPRSGTTLLQVLLDAHPDVAIPPESHIYRVFTPLMPRYGDLSDRANLLRFADDLCRDVWIQAWGLAVRGTDLVSEARRPGRAGVIDALFRRYAATQGASRWGEKTPYHVSFLPEIFADFPDAKVIHLVRDGRDVLESRRRVVWGPKSSLGVARQWKAQVDACRRFFTDPDDPRVMECRYTDLVADPRAWLERLQRFLDLSPVDTTDRVGQTDLSRNMVAHESQHHRLAEGISRGRVGVFRDALRPRDIELFESVAGDTLSRYGYERRYPAPRPATTFDRLAAWYRDQPRRIAVKYLREPKYLPMVLAVRFRSIRKRLSSSPGRGCPPGPTAPSPPPPV